MEAQRGISPLIATLILILIAVVGGGMVYAVFSAQAGSLAKNVDFQVQSASISNASGKVVISVTVKNTGTIAIDGVEVKVYGGGGDTVTLSIDALDPGETGGITDSEADPVKYKIGKSYVMELSAWVGSKEDVVATRSITVAVIG